MLTISEATANHLIDAERQAESVDVGLLRFIDDIDAHLQSTYGFDIADLDILSGANPEVPMMALQTLLERYHQAGWSPINTVDVLKRHYRRAFRQLTDRS